MLLLRRRAYQYGSGRLITPQEAKDMLITIALSKTDGDRGKAAKLLGMGVRTLRRKIAERRRADL